MSPKSYCNRITSYCSSTASSRACGTARWNALSWQRIQSLSEWDTRQRAQSVLAQTVAQSVYQTDTQHSLAYYSLISDIFFPCMGWHSPASFSSRSPGSVRADQKIFPHISRRRGKSRKEEREEKSQKGAYCSLFTLVFWWMRTFLSLLYSPFLLLLPLEKKNTIVAGISHHIWPNHFQAFSISKTIIIR